MIEFAAIYKGKGMQPSEKLKTILNQMVDTWAFYKQGDSYIQEGWYLNFRMMPKGRKSLFFSISNAVFKCWDRWRNRRRTLITSISCG